VQAPLHQRELPGSPRPRPPQCRALAAPRPHRAAPRRSAQPRSTWCCRRPRRSRSFRCHPTRSSRWSSFPTRRSVSSTTAVRRPSPARAPAPRAHARRGAGNAITYQYFANISKVDGFGFLRRRTVPEVLGVSSQPANGNVAGAQPPSRQDGPPRAFCTSAGHDTCAQSFGEKATFRRIKPAAFPLRRPRVGGARR